MGMLLFFSPYHFYGSVSGNYLAVSPEYHIIVIVISSAYHIRFDMGIVWYTFSHKFHIINICACTNDTHYYNYFKNYRLTTQVVILPTTLYVFAQFFFFPQIQFRIFLFTFPSLSSF